MKQGAQQEFHAGRGPKSRSKNVPREIEPGRAITEAGRTRHLATSTPGRSCELMLLWAGCFDGVSTRATRCSGVALKPWAISSPSKQNKKTAARHRAAARDILHGFLQYVHEPGDLVNGPTLLCATAMQPIEGSCSFFL